MEITQSPKEYMKEYREKITAKKQELQGKRKDEIMSVLNDLWTSREAWDPRIDAQLKQELRDYVQTLKSTEEHKEQAKKYHKDMTQVREFFSTIFDSTNPENKDKIKKMFAASKEYFQWIDKKNRETNQKALEKFLNGITPQQKAKMMAKIERVMNDPKFFAAEVQKIIESKPEMKTLAKMKEVSSRVLSDMDLLPLVGGWLMLSFLMVWLPKIIQSTPMTGVDAIGAIFTVLWWATAVISTVEQSKKLTKEQTQKRANKVIR